MKKMEKLLLISALIVAVAISACADAGYHYVVAEKRADTSTRPKSEAFYSEPSESAPKGNIRVRTLGLVDLRPKGKKTRIAALHIRMTIANTNEPISWTVDTQEQSLLFPNTEAQTPLYANSDSPGLPKLEIKAGELRTVDLFFTMPDKSGSEKDIPDFDFKWTVHSGPAIFTETTNFERAAQNENTTVVYPYETYPIGYGPVWWGGYEGPAIMSTPPIRVRK